MLTVNFKLYVDTDYYLPDLLACNSAKRMELEIEATISDGYDGFRMIGIEYMTRNGRELNESEIEDVVNEVGWDHIEHRALQELSELPEVA